MGEPPFIVFLLATLLVTLLAIKRGGARGPSMRWGVMAGALLGLAFASKLTAIIAIVAIVLWGGWTLLSGPLAQLLPTSLHLTIAGGQRSILWALLVVGVGLVTFVATNPFLYRDPVGRTLLLFQNRQTEMHTQAEVDPERAVTSIGQSARLVWRNSLIEDTWTESRLHRPVEAVLAVIGLGWLALRAVRHRAEAMVLLWVVGFFGGVTVGLGYVLDHYFVPTAIMGLILTGLTVGWGTEAAWNAARRVSRRRQRQPAAQQEPAAA
jgi:hypothetical protein